MAKMDRVGTSILQGGEDASLQITAHKLNRKNYLQWSQSIKLVIQGRGKLEHLIAATKPPKEDGPAFQGWDAENSIVIACVINFMEIEIGQTYRFLPTAKDV